MSRFRWITAVVAAVLTTALIAPPATARPRWDTSPAVFHHDNVRPMPNVVDLRVGEHANFDRVVIDLERRVPGYDVRYVRKLRYDGSGEPVPLKGKRFVAVTLFPAKAHNQKGASIYTGPRLRQYHLPTLRGVAMTGDFEGYVSFGLSLRSKEDFRVFILRKPKRIVIDLHH
jgi:hypothetical protein